MHKMGLKWLSNGQVSLQMVNHIIISCNIFLGFNEKVSGSNKNEDKKSEKKF